MDGFLGEIRMFAGGFAPRGWMECDGRILNIRDHSPLFSILSTKHGGDGIRSFALPDLIGRFPVGSGAGTGRTARRVGESGGAAEVTLEVKHLPPHRHGLAVGQGSGDEGLTAGGAGFGSLDGDSMRQGTLGGAGQSRGHENMPPYTSVRYIICVQGRFPSRKR